MPKKIKVTAYQKHALEYLRPPESISVSQWSEKNRILDARASAMPGHWRNEITPYLIDIMDEFCNYETEEIIFVKPTQVGGTEAMQNMLGYAISQDPAPALIVYPTDVLAENMSCNRLLPMLKSTPELIKKFIKKDSQKTELQFDNMYISLVGSNSPSSLASKPIRYLFLDEVDKYPSATRKEADPISLARERTKTFFNRKIYMCSTPTLRTGHIWKAKENADIEKHYFVPCPHCGKEIELKFAQIKWPSKEQIKTQIDRAEFAHYCCQECGEIITDQNKIQILKFGKWHIVKRNTQFSKSVVFWINTLYSPFVRFSQIAKEFMKSKDDPDMLHNFTNSWLAEPWEDTKLKTDAQTILQRQTKFDMYIVPPWTRLLTAGVDVQENCLYWTIRAWGNFLTSQNIAHGQAFSLSEITQIMNLEYKRSDSGSMLVDLVLIDSGAQTDEIYDYCAMNSQWALPCKGASNTMLSHYKLSMVNKSLSKAYGMNLVLIDTGKYKDMIAARMRKENGQGSWMVYKNCDLDYAHQVTSEHKVIEHSNGREVMKWVLKNSHADNHYLDAEVYAMAAADVLGVRNLFLRETESVSQKKFETQEENWIKNNDNWL